MSSARKILPILGFVLLLGIPAVAQWSKNGQPAADNGWRRWDGDFGAMLMITDDLQSFLDQWDAPAAPDYRPTLSPANAAARGETVAAVVLFNQCEAESVGTCRAVTDWKVTRPDGSVYAEHESTPLWDEVPPQKGHLQLGVAQLVFEVELDDPIGEYRIETRVRDLVAGKVVRLERTVSVVEAKDESLPAGRR